MTPFVKEFLAVLVNDLLNENYTADTICEEYWHRNGHEFESLKYKKGSGRFSITVEEKIGGEGEGDYYRYVFKITDRKVYSDIYLMFEASYDSWQGTDWSVYSDTNPRLVEPYERMIIDYREIK